MLFLFEVITASDRGTIWVIWLRHVPYVVVFVFAEFVDTYIRSLSIVFHQPFSRKYVHFILATAILDFWRMSTSGDTGSDTIKSLTPKTWGQLLQFSCYVV